MNATDNSLPVIIFDEFDFIKDDTTKTLMSHTIKALSDSGNRATVVLVGVAEDINTLVSEHQSVERNIAEIKMPRMSNDEMNEILDKRLISLNIRLEGDARWKIVTLARGLPEYVQALGRDSAIHALRSRRMVVKKEDVDEAITIALQHSDQSARNSYKLAVSSNNSKALHRQALLACALAKTDDEGKFAAKDVVEPMTRVIGYKVAIDKFQSHLTVFSDPVRGQILEKSGKPRAFKYRFREPKMQPYVIMQGIANGMVSQNAMEKLSSPEQPKFSSEF